VWSSARTIEIASAIAPDPSRRADEPHELEIAPAACAKEQFSRIESVQGASKTLIAAIVALLLAAGLAACGGSDSSSSTAAEAGGQGQSEGGSQGEANGGAQGKPGSKAGEGKSGGSAGGEGQPGGNAAAFVPKHHHDSGGGSTQYRVKGGDNSVQEFGAEADTAERDAAAVVLHDFLDARAEGNWAAACGFLAKSATEAFEKLAAQAKQIEDTSCAGILAKLTNPAAKASMKAEAERADVGSLRIEGERAFVLYTAIGGTILAMPMANEGGAWKVASLAGTPLD
jgi:hypothetical protein